MLLLTRCAEKRKLKEDSEYSGIAEASSGNFSFKRQTSSDVSCNHAFLHKCWLGITLKVTRKFYLWQGIIKYFGCLSCERWGYVV